jgi:hypothetical protein
MMMLHPAHRVQTADSWRGNSIRAEVVNFW